MEKSPHMKRVAIGFFMMAVLILNACSSGPKQPPIDKLKLNLKDVPTYSIILEDMKEEGNFKDHYFHKYRIVMPEKSEAGTTDWLEVSSDYYQTNQPFLGMTLAVKKDGQMSSSVSPAGYQYVGDAKYGQWRNDRQGDGPLQR